MDDHASDDQKASARRQRERFATVFTMLLLAVGIGLLWLIKKQMEIEGDAAFLGLLVVPLLAHLVMSGRLEKFSIFGASASFIDERVEDIKKNVIELGESGPERSTYLGKLGQVLAKATSRVGLIYADVDGLRELTRNVYVAEAKAKADAAKEPERRRTEREVRDSVIRTLVLTMTDAFFAKHVDGAKQDVFILEEPDVAMITRKLNGPKALEIAELALNILRDKHGINATMVVLGAEDVKAGMTPQELDR